MQEFLLENAMLIVFAVFILVNFMKLYTDFVMKKENSLEPHEFTNYYFLIKHYRKMRKNDNG